MSTQSHTDPPNHINARAARFVPAPQADDVSMDTAPLITRDVNYEPARKIYDRETVLNALTGSLDEQLTLGTLAPSEVQWRLRTLAQLSQARGHHEDAIMRANHLRRAFDLNAQDWQMLRRSYTALHQPQLVEDTLIHSASDADELTATMSTLEHARMVWMNEEPGERVALMCDRLPLNFEDDAVTGFVETWRRQMILDAQLSGGDVDAALESVDDLLSNVPLPKSIETSMRIMQALWYGACGQSEKAQFMLMALMREGAPLSDDDRGVVLDVLAFLEVAQGEGHLTDWDGLGAWHTQSNWAPTMVALLAQIANKTSQKEAAQLLRSNLKNYKNDIVLLSMYVNILEQLHATNQTGWMEELIRALNFSVELTKDPTQRAEVLYRLGQLYEVELKDDVAATDVLVEALNLVEDHPQVIRALGRIYSRRGAWSQLAQLYLREIDTLGQHEHVWRRHYQVAKLYETKLNDTTQALHHYKIVLSQRPCDLPALKASARLLERLSLWHELADLFLCNVPNAKSQRQRLYLLDKVAQVAEAHLEHDEVAMGAWEEILSLMPQHPTAFSSLGRLYAKNKQWAKLLALNLQEMALMEGEQEELAGMHVKNASLYLKHMNKTDEAEASYRAALSLIPDYLPALEGLGRMLVSAGRWDDVVRMTSAEFAAMEDAGEQIRQLTSLAQLCEAQLDRPADAIKLYRAALQRDSNCTHAYTSLMRLYRQTAQWGSLVKLLTHKSNQVEQSAQRAAIQEEIGRILEWSMGHPQDAFGYYRTALLLDPNQVHALEGMMRTWRTASIETNQLIGWLEQTVEQSRGESHHRHCVALARLYEFQAQVPEAGASWRCADVAVSREHTLLRRLTLGLFGDRQSMAQMRQQQPLHDWEFVACASRDTQGPSLHMGKLKRAWKNTPEAIRTRLAGEFEWKIVSKLEDASLACLAVDVTDLVAQRDLGALGAQIAPDEASRLRLRALLARDNGDLDGYGQWTEDELTATPDRVLRTQRLLEWYGLDNKTSVQAKTTLVRAVQCAFPELEQVQAQDIFDGPVTDWLYDTLYASKMWALLGQCLGVHVKRKSIGKIRKVYLYDMLADVMERYLEDEERALDAKISAWEISQDAEHLPTIVRLCLALEFNEQALGYQHELYEAMADKPLVPASERIAQGLELVDLMLAQEEVGVDDVLMMLDLLLEDYADEPEVALIQLKMARVHAKYANARTASKLFAKGLSNRDTEAHEDDWHVYVDLVANKLKDPMQAYQLQWRLVRAFPTNVECLDLLLELADSCDQLTHCAGLIVEFAAERGPASQRVLYKTAALLFETHLEMMEDAANAYEKLALLMTKPAERNAMKRKQAWCLTRVLGRQKQALQIYRDLTGDDPFDTSAFEGMASLLSNVQTMDRARVIEQVLRTLGQEVPSETPRGKTTPSRVLDDVEEVADLLPKNLSLAVFDAFSSASGFIEKQWGDQLPDKRSLDNDRRIAREWEPVADLFAIMFDAVGIRRMRTLFGENLSAPFEIVWDKEVLLWLNINTLERLSEAEMRYMAAYCAALVWTDLPGIRHLDGRHIWSLFDAVHMIQQQESIDPTRPVSAMTADLAKTLATTRHTVLRRRISAPVVDAYETLVQCNGETWRKDVDLFAHRLATTICGDVEASIGCILKLEGWKYPLEHAKTQSHLRNHKLSESMIRFALSEDYLKVRYAMGLSGRPSNLER